jgi:hypothetical protein
MAAVRMAPESLKRFRRLVRRRNAPRRSGTLGRADEHPLPGGPEQTLTAQTGFGRM